MKKIILFMLMVSVIYFGNLTIVYATSGYLRSKSIKICNGVTYGQHSSDNHWHVAIKNSDGKYNASGDPIYNDPCANNTDDSSNNETVNASNSSKSSDATIKSITVNNNNIEVSDSMSDTTTEENSNIKVVLNNISASAQYNNDIELVIGDNLQTIKVIAENGNTKEYKLNIIREKELSNNKNIKIFVDNKEIKFTLYKNEELSISSKASKVNITYELEDDKASVEISGNENLKVGKNEIVITAIAENGDKQEYTLIVEKSSIATEIISSIVGITMLGGFCYLIYILIKKKK